MKKALKIALFSVLGLVVVAGVLVWMEFGSLIKGAMSCEKLDEGMYYTKTKKGRTGWTLPFSLEGLLWKLGFNSAYIFREYLQNNLYSHLLYL